MPKAARKTAIGHEKNHASHTAPKLLHSAVTTSGITPDLYPARHTTAKVLDNVREVADGVAVGDEIPSASAVAVVVEP